MIRHMKTIEDARNHCRFVGEGIKQCVADGEDPFARFESSAACYRARPATLREGGVTARLFPASFIPALGVCCPPGLRGLSFFRGMEIVQYLSVY